MAGKPPIQARILAPDKRCYGKWKQASGWCFTEVEFQHCGEVLYRSPLMVTDDIESYLLPSSVSPAPIVVVASSSPNLTERVLRAR